MATQTYETHRHTPRLTGVGFLFVVLAGIAFLLRWFGIGGRWSFGAGLGALMASQVVMLLISRVYTTALQDRIIKLEMNIRLGQLLGPAARTSAERLSKAQLIALRFASDEELPALLERAEREALSAEQIKRAVTRWTPDLDRT
jgi:hypothetical protein